ncbi:Transcription elongation factor A protein 1 [Cichlidogyrus casuarinus]|uniref:Transcription elongation factor n=1 Tax=Cichlidogyrus casuarinus TaxID=1844966 RepID=A0ABD2PQN9_9PLAT
MDETVKAAKKLEKMLNNDSIVRTLYNVFYNLYIKDENAALKYLRQLKTLDMTLEILTKTGVGIIINRLRKETNNSEIASLGKNLIKRWKKLVPDKPDGSSKRSADDDRVSDDDGPIGTKRICTGADSDSNDRPVSQPSNPTPFFMLKNQDTSDPVRLKAREMIATALCAGEIPSGAFDAEYLAGRIETSVFKVFNDTDPKYKQRVRTRVMNLKDSNNPNLRINVLMGTVKPEKLAVMTSEEMASKEMKEMREKFIKETIDDHQMTTVGGTETDLLKCGKCRKNNCTYNQVQTRSADEPMTTFVYCNNCGHRWKV